MNTKTPTPPAIPLPDHLPPQAALALFDCLSHLLDAVWQQYESVLVEQILIDLNAPPEDLGEFGEDADDDTPL